MEAIPTDARVDTRAAHRVVAEPGLAPDRTADFQVGPTTAARTLASVSSLPGVPGVPAVPPVPAGLVDPLAAPSIPPVRRKRGRPRDPLADGRILAAASALILRRGFDAMTVDEVAQNAGVGKATVYRRWARKEDLAVAAMERLYSDEMPVPDTGSLRGDLAESYRAQLGFARSAAGADYLRTLVKESMRDQRMAALYRAAHDRSERNAQLIFARARNRGEIDVDVPVELLVKLLSGLVVLATVMGTDTPTPEEVELLVDLVVRGVSA